MLHAARTARHTLRGAQWGACVLENQDTCQRQKFPQNVHNTCGCHAHTHTHTCINIASVDGGVFGFPPFDIVVATRVFQLFVVSNSIKFACALKLIKAAACRALKWRRTHTDTHTNRHTQQYSALIECICVRVFMTKLGPRWHVQGQVAVKSMPKMRLRS